MSVEFQEENDLNRMRPTGQSSMQSATGLVGLVIKLGLAKDDASANKALTGIAICAILLTLFVIFKFIL